jgi:hypothetical protein
MNNDSPDPALERAFILKSMYMGKNLDKRLLEHIFRILPAGREAVADAEHFGTVLVVQFPLRSSIIFKAACNNGLLRHEGGLITLNIDKFFLPTLHLIPRILRIK